MNLKEVIRYIAEEDLEINLTIQIGSDSNEVIENLKREVEILRQTIGEGAIEEATEDMSLEEAQEEYDSLEIGPDPEADDDDIDMSKLQEDQSENEDFESDGPAQTPEEHYGEEESVENGDTDIGGKAGEAMDALKSEVDEQEDTDEQPADPEQAEEEFQEMFGEEEEEEEETDPEPTQEDRDEAEADFEQLFGDAV